jgi:hypothetical protein
MADDIQDEELVKADLRRQERLERARAARGPLPRRRALCDPMAAGGFNGGAGSGPQRNYNFDSTAMDGLDRFEAALGAVTMPKTERWLGLTVYDKDLARNRRRPALARACDRPRAGIACTRRTPISASRPARTAERSAATAPARCGSTKQGPRAVLPRAPHERELDRRRLRGRSTRCTASSSSPRARRRRCSARTTSARR